MNRIIPTTNLRKLYSFFRFFSTKTQLAILEDYNRGANYKKLVELYNESKEYFSTYNNDEEFVSEVSKRKKIAPENTLTFKNTNDVIAFFKLHDGVSVDNNETLNFSYIEREVDPRRMTKAHFDNYSSGKSSGTGGIDFLAWNNIRQRPIIGEIKCGSDETPFFAFLQLLMYCSEMATDSQIERINKTNLFKHKIKLPYFLYIFLADFNLKGEKGKFTEPLKKLTSNVANSLSDIENIVILDARKESKQILCL